VAEKTFKGRVKITQDDGSPATVVIGGNSGTIELADPDTAVTTIRIRGGHATIELGGSGQDGDLKIQDKNGKVRFDFRGDTAELLIDGTKVAASDGANNLKGDIILRSAVAAEDFESAEAEDVPPGSVMVLTDDGHVRVSKEAYDKRVAGVLCGAPDSRPGLVLGRPADAGPRRLPIALIGTTLCRVDATTDPIKAGDLLTTSATDGHAMRASDATKALGATIGKALRPLARGKKELVPILVTLQ
jgi:hypothetical protein